MFGFHPTELMIIFVVALLVFGPKKLPEIGSQMGRTLNAFKKGMRELREPLDNPFDMETFTAQQREIQALEARRLELEILERELAVKRAEAALKAENAAISYDAAKTVEADYADEDYIESEMVIDMDSSTLEEVAHTSAEPVDAVKSVEAAEPVSEASSLSKVSVETE